MAATSNSSNDESSEVLSEYLELFHCLGYRYKYHLAPNAVLDWFDTFHVRGAIKIHKFLLMKFHGTRQHLNFDKANFCGAIEQNETHLSTKRLSSKSPEFIDPLNKVTGITSLKSRAESDIESDTDLTVSESGVEKDTHLAGSTTNVTGVKPDTFDESDESAEYVATSYKRARYSTPPPTPFKCLRRLPVKRRRAESSDDDDDDNDSSKGEAEDAHKTRQLVTSTSNDYSPLRYLEAMGNLRDDSKDQPIRLRLSYRRHLKNQVIQFALIIYEREDQQKFLISRRKMRMPDFTKCINDDDDDELSSNEDPLECIDLQPAVIFSSSKDGEVRETIATVSTPNSAEIASALEEAAFAIQTPVQRTPTKTTPIATPKPRRRQRPSTVSISGVLPLELSSTNKKSERSSTNSKAPKLSAARSLRL